MDFSAGAGAQTPNSIIPNGALLWVVINMRGIKPNPNTGTSSLDLELTVDDNQPFARKKLWQFIGDPMHPGNSEGYRQQGMVAVTRILEAGRQAGPHNPAGYQIADYSALNGLRVPVKIGIEAGKDGYDDKNKVAEWLTPNPASQSGYKLFVKLQSGDHNLPSAQPAAQGGFAQAGFGQQASNNAFGGSPTPAASSGWGTPSPQPAAASTQTAGWGTPPANQGAVQPGFQQGQAPAQQQQVDGHSSATSGMMTSHSEQQPGWLAQANAAHG